MKHSPYKYRPISLLSNTSKVLEQLIYNEVISKITDFISNVQFGFLKNRSTLQQLLIFVNEIFTCGTQSDAVYFDIRKAFDSVCHNQLLVKLWLAGISGHLWSWFRSYLTYQTDPSSLSLTINLQVYFLFCLVSLKAVSLDPCCFSSTLMIYFILIFIILYLLLQMTPSALDLLPTALMKSYCNMTSIYYLTGVLDHIYVSILPNVYIFHLEPTESHHIT